MCLTRFEDLVGTKEGESDTAQRQAIINLANFLSIPISEGKIRRVVENLYGISWTFRKGQIGSWKEHFKQEHIETMDDISIYWGDESDHSWVEAAHAS